MGRWYDFHEFGWHLWNVGLMPERRRVPVHHLLVIALALAIVVLFNTRSVAQTSGSANPDLPSATSSESLSVVPTLIQSPSKTLPPRAVTRANAFRQGIVRERIGFINPTIFYSDKSRKKGNISLAIEKIELNLFDDLTFVAEFGRVESLSDNNFTLFGRIEGVKFSDVILVINSGTVTGSIMVDGSNYQIRHLEGNYHIIAQIDGAFYADKYDHDAARRLSTALDGDLVESGDTSSPSTTGIVPLTVADDDSQILVMVAYTEDAENATSDIVSEIFLAVHQVNQSFANSGITTRIALAASPVRVNYQETGDLSIDLSRLRIPGDGHLDNLLVLRDQYAADLVSLWVEEGEPCGFANHFEPPDGNPDRAFSILVRRCGPGLIFNHELGHTLGADHDWFVYDHGAAFPYSHGYVNVDKGWFTIMAFFNECFDAGVFCQQLPLWSNPNRTHDGVPLGVPEGDPNAADNRKTINNTAGIVSNYRVGGAAFNGIPVARNDQFEMTSRGSLVVDAAGGILSNDTDPEGASLTAILSSDVANGNLVLAANGAFTYSPQRGFFGTDSFTYRASDGVNSSNIATVTIVVPPISMGWLLLLLLED